jgi:hypothetical protein
VIGRYTIHVLGLLRNTAKKVPTADHDRQFHARFVDIPNLPGDLVNPRAVNPKSPVRGKSFPGQLQ